MYFSYGQRSPLALTNGDRQEVHNALILLKWMEMYIEQN